MTTKLTLSIDSRVVAKARRISKLRKTSISAMVAHYIASIHEDEDEHAESSNIPTNNKLSNFGNFFIILIPLLQIL